MEQDEKLVLGTEKVGKLLLTYALPSIVAMTATSLYNIFDSAFIGRGVGSLGLAGLAVSFPFMNLTAAFGAMVGIGATTVVSHKLGQRDYKGAETALGNVVLLNVTIGAVITALGLIFLEPILYFFGASEQTLPYAKQYMEILLYANVINHLYRGLSDVMRASGYPRKSMYLTLMSVVVNGVLDYLFIMVFDWGIAGAAWATVAGQVVALVYVLIHFGKRDSLLHFKREIFRFDTHITGQIISIGLGPFIMNTLGCFVVLLINTGLRDYGGDMYISAYGVVNRIIFLFLMVVMGFNQGMQPIAGYNFGAGKYGRVMQVYKYTLLCAISVNCLGFVICEFAPDAVISLFTEEAELTDICRHALRIMASTLPLVAVQMVSTNFFQSLGFAKKAIFLSTNRQLLFLIPFLIVLPRFFGTDGIWASLPLADTISVIVAIIMVVYQIRQFKKLEASPEAQTATQNLKTE